jgi:hypothetical protein
MNEKGRQMPIYSLIRQKADISLVKKMASTLQIRRTVRPLVSNGYG